MMAKRTIFGAMLWKSALLLAICASLPTHASTLSVLYNFSAPANAIATAPGSLIQGSDGNLYGTNAVGGTYNQGMVFRITPDGTVTILFSFLPLVPQGNVGGRFPVGVTMGSDGNVYGATNGGGANDSGTIFKMTTEGALTTLYTFSAIQTGAVNPDGWGPNSLLVAGTDGNFYGTTGDGGIYDGGTVFRISPTGTLTTLYSFSRSDSLNGYHPEGLARGTDGNFYGVTTDGGTYNSGTLYQITPSGTVTLLHAFNPYVEGDSPSSPPVQGADGNWYGVTLGGFYNLGTVYRLDQTGKLTTLHCFSGPDGEYPFASLILGKDGNLYGTTEYGGASNAGAVFKITQEGSLTLLHCFSTLSDAPAFVGSNFDGAAPTASLMQARNGSFYGTAPYGGEYQVGTVFRLDAYLSSDFDGRGRPDLIFQNPATGQLAVWFVSGVVATSGAEIAQNPTWRCAGASDFNFDGQTDLVFQNSKTGQLAIEFMAGTNPTNGTYLYPIQDPAWQCVGISDFNGDSKPDLLFQNRTTGRLAIWYMDGSAVLFGAYVYPVPPAGWQCVGSGDFNGDGHPDLLFQNPTTGQMAVWFMDENYLLSAAYVYPSQEPAWQAVSVADYSGDGKPDIVFQNRTTGQLAVWYMNGNYLSTGLFISPTQNPEWLCIGPR